MHILMICLEMVKILLKWKNLENVGGLKLTFSVIIFVKFSKSTRI